VTSDRLTVREMARGLPVGGSRSGLLCPACGGGRSRERSLSVYRNEFGVGGRCHRASCPLNVFRPDIVTRDVTVAEFKPRPYPFHLVYPYPDHSIWDGLKVPFPDRTPELAARLGVLTSVYDAREVVWEVRDYQWATRGHISRTYPDKRIRVWREQEGPFHAYHGFKRTRVLWVVEDMVSAAQIAMLGGNALALLGTNFSANGQAELRGYLTRIHATVGYPEVKVALDPDAADKGARLARELTSRIGCATMYVPLSADPKDLPEGELARLVREA
jgi:hypothetical protein